MDTEFKSRSFKETKASEKSRCRWMDNVKMEFGVRVRVSLMRATAAPY